MSDKEEATDTPTSTTVTATAATTSDHDQTALQREASNTSLNLSSITEGQNERGIPSVRFIEDIGTFSNTFTPPASAELLIGAFTDLFQKYKAFETNLTQKRVNFQQKIPEIEKSLVLVRHLKEKMEAEETVVTRYGLADTVYAKAELECNGIVNLWLGANVMLEYTYDEAIQLLASKEELAKKEYGEIGSDLAFTRNQIITAEVNISRIYNYDVRAKRAQKALSG